MDSGSCWGRQGTGKAGGLLFRHSGYLADMEPDQQKVHVTDYTNASRTMLFDIHKLRWDDEILEGWIFQKRCFGK